VKQQIRHNTVQQFYVQTKSTGNHISLPHQIKQKIDEKN